MKKHQSEVVYYAKALMEEGNKDADIAYSVAYVFLTPKEIRRLLWQTFKNKYLW